MLVLAALIASFALLGSRTSWMRACVPGRHRAGVRHRRSKRRASSFDGSGEDSDGCEACSSSYVADAIAYAPRADLGRKKKKVRQQQCSSMLESCGESVVRSSSGECGSGGRGGRSRSSACSSRNRARRTSSSESVTSELTREQHTSAPASEATDDGSSVSTPELGATISSTDSAHAREPSNSCSLPIRMRATSTTSLQFRQMPRRQFEALRRT